MSSEPSRRRVFVAPRNWALMVLLGALVGYWVTGEGSSGGITQREVEPLVAGFNAARARAIVLERNDVAAVTTGGVERTSLAFGGSSATTVVPAGDEVWKIEEFHGATAFSERVDRLLSRIGSMTTLDLVTADPKAHAQYGMTEEKALRVRVLASEGGSEPPMVDLLMAPATHRGAYVRLFGEPQVWRIARFTPPSAAPRAWLDDSSLMPLSDLAIGAVRASGPAVPGGFQVRTVPGGQDRFTDAEGNALNGQAVLDLFKRLRTLFPVEVLAAKPAGEPLDPAPWLSLEIHRTVGGSSFQIDFVAPGADAGADGGAAASTTLRAALVGGTTVVTVSAATVGKIVQSIQSLKDSPQNR